MCSETLSIWSNNKKEHKFFNSTVTNENANNAQLWRIKTSHLKKYKTVIQFSYAMNLWEFEGGVVCAYSCPVCFLWGGSSLLGTTGATLWVTPLVFMWHQHGSTGWRTHPCVLAGLGGFREHSTGDQPRTCRGAVWRRLCGPWPCAIVTLA